MTKRIFTKVLAVAIVVIMMCSVCAPVVGAAANNRAYDKDNDGTISYVALGASNTNGFGLMGYLPDELYNNPVDKMNGSVYGYKSEAEASYPVLLQKALAEMTGKTVELDQLAISSMRAEELHVLLDNEYDGDKYTEWRFTAGHNWFNMAHEDGLDGLRAEYQEYVKNADVITIDIGANNFGVYASNRIFSNKFDNDFTRFDEGTQASIAKVKSEIKAVVEAYLPAELGGTLDHIVDTMALSSHQNVNNV